MNRGKYFGSVKKAYQLMNQLSLVKEKNVVKINRCVSDKYSNSFKKVSRNGSYIETYKSGIESNEYDLLLTDSSFLQFSFDEDPGIIRYAYYPNPNHFKTYEEFLNLELESSVEEVGDSCRDLYEQYVEEQTEFSQVTSFRYDYEERLFQEMIHPAAHFHFGRDGVRVSCDKVLTLFSFAVLVINYYYASSWKDAVRDENVLREVLSAKGQCEFVTKELFTQKEKSYFYVS